MSTALYVRVSTQRQAHQQTSDQQLARLRAWCADQAWEVRDEFVFRDDGVSGSTLRRPGLDALRDAVAVAQCDRIVLTAPDRLARTMSTKCSCWKNSNRLAAVSYSSTVP